jgi:hypothetical protein
MKDEGKEGKEQGQEHSQEQGHGQDQHRGQGHGHNQHLAQTLNYAKSRLRNPEIMKQRTHGKYSPMFRGLMMARVHHSNAVAWSQAVAIQEIYMPMGDVQMGGMDGVEVEGMEGTMRVVLG